MMSTKVVIPRICLIGHNEYSIKMRSKEVSLPFGEVNNARKLQAILNTHQIPTTEVLDIFELFEIEDMEDSRGQLFLDMFHTNYDLGASGIDFITDFDNELTKTFHRNLDKKLEDHERNVLMILSWPGRALPILSTGIQKRYPTIAKEDSYTHASHLPHPFPMKPFAKEVDILISESLLGAINCDAYEIPKHKFLFLPNLSPPEAKALVNRPEKEKREYKEDYIQSLIERSGKKIMYTNETIVLGYPSRFVRRKNTDMLIWAISELYKKHPNVLLVLKGDVDSEFDACSLYSEKLHQLLRSAEEEPWFLWDRSPTPYPEVLKVYGCFDICPFISGGELGSNTIAELCAMGVPCALLDASVNPYLYQGMTEFIKGGDLCQGSWVYRQPVMDDLIAALSSLIQSPEKRNQLGESARALAEIRFGEHQLIKRVPLLAKAAWSLFHDDADAKLYRKTLLNKLKQDFQDFSIE